MLFARFGPVSHARTRNALFPFGSGGDLTFGSRNGNDGRQRNGHQGSPRIPRTRFSTSHTRYYLLLLLLPLLLNDNVIALLPVHIRRKGTEYSVSNLQSSPVLHLPYQVDTVPVSESVTTCHHLHLPPPPPTPLGLN